MVKIVCISDTHEQWHDLAIPECDILISAGDYSYRGKPDVVREFHQWLDRQPARHVISVQGNHELWVEKNFQQAMEMVPARVHFIDEGAFEIDGIKIYGSAVQPEFNDWAWNVPRGAPIAKHWAAIPDDTEILITHGPPFGILDRSLSRIARRTDESLGCQDLLDRIGHLPKLKIHVFGHIHGSSGVEKRGNTTFINASVCDENYEPTNPIRICEI